jgi:cytochrome c-type biogenesis protein
MAELTLFITFIAGLLSFSSPCVFPLVPGFLAYLAGSSLSESRFRRKEVLVNASCFVLGLSLVFATFGVVLNSIFAAVGFELQAWLSRLGGAVVIFFGLNLTGLVQLPLLERGWSLKVGSSIRPQFVRSFALGSAFAAGWTPCVGPVLGAVLGLAVAEPGSAFSLLMAYSLGLGIPFLIAGPFAAQALSLARGHGKSVSYIRTVFGAFLIVVGILAFTQNLGIIGTPALLNLG